MSTPTEEILQLVTSVDGDQPWNRIKTKRNEQGKLVKGESEEAWQAFMHYRNMQYLPLTGGEGPRRLLKVAEWMNKKITLIQHWSSKWNWPTRVLAFDRAMIQKQAEEDAWQLQEAKKRVAWQTQMLAMKGCHALKQKAAGIENARDQL
jgi:hypothetical protein